MATLEEIHDPVRIVGGKRIIFGTRSASDATNWECCSCGVTNKAERRLIFTLPAFRCKCGKQFDGVMDFCLANVKANGITLVGRIKEQAHEEMECITYAISSNMEIMHNSDRALRNTKPENIESSDMDTSVHSLWYKRKFPGLRSGLHKLLHLCQRIRKEGVHFESGEYYQVGKTRVIYCDNFEAICRLIADGIPVLAPLTVGYKYPNLQYCQLYQSVPSDEPVLQHCFNKTVQGGHMLCLIGAVQNKDGQRGFYGLDAAGELFCPQFVSPDDIGVVPAGGFGKVNANSDFMLNFLAFSRKGDHEDQQDVELLDEDEDSTEVSQANRMSMVHGEYFKKQFTAMKNKLRRILGEEVADGDDGDAAKSSLMVPW